MVTYFVCIDLEAKLNLGLTYQLAIAVARNVVQNERNGCQVYHYSLPDYLNLSLERVQKRALKIIYGYDNHYREVLQMAELKTLRDRREDLCLKFFNNIVSNPLDCLYHLLPFDNRDQLMELRRRRPFRVSFKTNRFRDTFIPASARHFN